MRTQIAEFERDSDQTSPALMTGLNADTEVPPLLRHRPFACWQIALVSVFTSYLGAGALIAINLSLMGHRAMAILQLLISAVMSLSTFVKGNSSFFWTQPLLSYLFARFLFRWQYAPFKKQFVSLSTPPKQFAPLWYAVACAIAPWVTLFLVLLLVTVCMDVMLLLSGQHRRG